MARPREFDENKVLQAALQVFWENGYEGSSLSDLTAAMGLTKSSLYKAFGNKETLFWRVVELYNRDHLGFRLDALSEPTPRRIAERLLYGMTELHSGERTPSGCLELNAALACSTVTEPIRRQLLRGREGFRLELRGRFEETMGTAPLPPGMTSDDAASLVISLIQGLAVQAKAGHSQESARRVVRAVLLSWPET